MTINEEGSVWAIALYFIVIVTAFLLLSKQPSTLHIRVFPWRYAEVSATGMV